MRVLILNASPKRRGGASRLFSALLRPFLAGCEKKVLSLCGPGDFTAALEALSWAEAVVISAPLYVDAAPSHVVDFLERAEVVCREKGLKFRLYVLSNSGFVEGRQNELHLRLYEGWCRRSGVFWGGGVGIGGGVMLYWMLVLMPVFAVLHTIDAIMLARAGELTPLAALNCYSDALVTLTLSMGFIVCMGLLGRAVRRGECRKNLYTRVLMPSFLFLFGADLFMLISALFHGTLPHKLFQRSDSGR